MIKNITVENVKGIPNKSFDLDVLPNKPSLFVAPNGFGKSSIAVAFASLNPKRLNLDKEHLHNGDTNKTPLLILTYYNESGNTSHALKADKNINQIANHFDFAVINSPIKAKGVGQSFGGRTNVSASLIIEPVTLIDTIPKKQTFDYYKAQKESFDINPKLLSNISDYFKNSQFIKSISNNFSILDKAIGKTVTKRLDNIKQDMNSQKSRSKLIDWVNTNKLNEFKSINEIELVANLIKNSTIKVGSEAEKYLAVLQILELYNSDKKKFKDACKYSNYKLEKDEYMKLLKAFDSSSHNIKPKEKQGKLIVEFPKANQISNGERDVLLFITLFQRAKRKFKKDNCILIIDEVFDYLDDANLIAVQYYITELIKEYKQSNKKIYPLILTHLNPYYFKNYAFSKQHVYFLYKSTIILVIPPVQTIIIDDS
ncbi:hypothetical protein MCHI_002061 [Candidatus Magnetoovum chiemensis]|nr:hypothetical protein MCHI_002061 [Candidatus Magnetoovum chiemensis]